MKSIRQRFVHAITKTGISRCIIDNPRCRIVFTAVISLLINLFYALYHGILGIGMQSLWFITVCAYYSFLSIARFSAVLCEYKEKHSGSINTEYFVMKISGVLLILLSLILIAITYISISQNITTKYDEITMITIATYVFTKLTLIIIKAVRQRKYGSSLLTVIRNITYAEVAVSVLNLQRSMLASFGEMSNATILNGLTSAFVCLFVLSLGCSMIKMYLRKEKKYGKISIGKDESKNRSKGDRYLWKNRRHCCEQLYKD